TGTRHDSVRSGNRLGLATACAVLSWSWPGDAWSELIFSGTQGADRLAQQRRARSAARGVAHAVGAEARPTWVRYGGAMLQPGELAPEFELADETGSRRRLVDLL